MRIGVGASRTAWYMAGMQKQDLDDLFAALATMAKLLDKLANGTPVTKDDKAAIKKAVAAIAHLKTATAAPPVAAAAPAPVAPPAEANPFMQAVDQNPPPRPVAAVPVARPGATQAEKNVGRARKAPAQGHQTIDGGSPKAPDIGPRGRLRW